MSVLFAFADLFQNRVIKRRFMNRNARQDACWFSLVGAPLSLLNFPLPWRPQCQSRAAAVLPNPAACPGQSCIQIFVCKPTKPVRFNRICSSSVLAWFVNFSGSVKRLPVSRFPVRFAGPPDIYKSHAHTHTNIYIYYFYM